MKPPFSYIPLLPVLVALVAGILFERAVGNVWWCVVPCLAAVALWAVGRRPLALYFAVLASGWMLGILQRTADVDPAAFDRHTTFCGTVMSESEGTSSRNLIVSIDGRADSLSVTAVAPVRCYLTVFALSPEIRTGDRVRFRAEFDRPSGSPDLPDEFTPDEFFYRERIAVTARAESESVTVDGEAGGMTWWLSRLRGRVASLIASTDMTSETMDFVAAVLLGDDTMLSPDVRDSFSGAGIAHVLALSGLHVAILACIVTIGLFPLSLAGFHRLRLAVTIAVLWFYAAMTGLSPSVTRAVIMTTMILLGYLLQRRGNAFNSLCLAAVVILVFSPRTLYSVSFQLTFAAVAAILIFNIAVRIPHDLPRWAKWLLETLKVSFAAVLGTGLLSAYYFHQFPLAFMLTNVPLALLLPAVVGIAVVLLVLAAFGVGAGWLADVVNWLYDAIETVAGFTVSLPGTSVGGIYFSGWLLVPAYVAILLFVAALYYRRRALWLSSVTVAVLTVIIGIASREPLEGTELYIPRTAYSTSMLVRENNRLRLVTTARQADIPSLVDGMERRYSDYMSRRGIDSIEVVDRDGFSSGALMCRGRQVVFVDSYFIVVNSADDVRQSAVKPKYALVCAGFKGDVTDVVDIVSPDTVLLARDIHPSRLARFADSLTVRSVPFRSLRDAPFNIMMSL